MKVLEAGAVGELEQAMCALFSTKSASGGEPKWGSALFGLFPTKTDLEAKEKPLTNQGFLWRGKCDSRRTRHIRLRFGFPWKRSDIDPDVSEKPLSKPRHAFCPVARGRLYKDALKRHSLRSVALDEGVSRTAVLNYSQLVTLLPRFVLQEMEKRHREGRPQLSVKKLLHLSRAGFDNDALKIELRKLMGRPQGR